jgi:cell division septation protein DedD
MIDAQDEQFVGLAPVVDPKGRHAPAAHDSAGAKPRHWTFELAICQAFDAARDLCVQLRGGGGVAFVEIADRLDDIGDRLFGVGDLLRPSAASMISRARFASTTRP